MIVVIAAVVMIFVVVAGAAYTRGPFVAVVVAITGLMRHLMLFWTSSSSAHRPHHAEARHRKETSPGRFILKRQLILPHTNAHSHTHTDTLLHTYT